MQKFISLQEIDQVVETIRAKCSIKPRIGLILGSGLSDVAETVTEATIIPFQELPGWPVSTVFGHIGQLVMGSLEGQPVMVMQGRVHFYEGYSMAEITLPVRAMQRIGVEIMIVTNAAGGVNPDFSPGDVMLITDNLNLMGMTGQNPLMGPNLDEIGPRFPDMSQSYDKELAGLARAVAKDEGIDLQEGIYCGLSGPSFESPADLRFLRMAGADAVGMSTVPEVIVARHGGLSVMGLSGISNKANLDGSTVTTHEEVIQAGKVIAPKMEKIIRGVLNRS
jgi:purine-nucleoside phosphorylase